MESQVPHPVGHTYDQDPHDVGPHSVVEGEGHEHQEKTSVLKKVKNKAKKIKHKLHLDGHGKEHEQENKVEHEFAQDARGGYEEDDDEDEAEEMVQDPEINGAPMYESSAIRSSNLPAQPQAPTFENPTATAEHRHDYPKTPADSMKETNPGHHNVPSLPQIGDLIPLQEEDPHAPNPAGRISPPNYESKVSDPTGEPGKVADMDPSVIPTGERGKAADMDPTLLLSSLEKMTISDRNPTGSHDQLAPESKSTGQASYAQKMTLAPSMIADKAVSVKNAVASKFGYGEGGNNPGPGAVQKVTATVTGTLAPVYGKVADAGSSVVSKVKGGGGGSGGDAAAVPDKGLSVTEYLAEKLRPGEDDKALSDMISDRLPLSKVSDVKAGESHPTPVGRVTESEEVRRDLGTGMENRREGEDAIAAGKENTGGGGGGGMVDKLKGAVTSWMGKQVDPDYSGAADSPSEVRSEGGEVGEKAEFGDQERRLQGSGTGMENRREGEDAIAAGKENTGGGGGGGGGMVDKLKGVVTSWMGKQVDQDNSGAADPPSEVRSEGGEVGEKAEFGDQERRLQGSGTGMENRREGEDAIAAGKENTGGGGGGGGMVDKLKGAVTSWMGKQVDQDNSGAADPPSEVRSEGGEVGEKAEFSDQERKLQGSGN